MVRRQQGYRQQEMQTRRRTPDSLLVLLVLILSENGAGYHPPGLWEPQEMEAIVTRRLRSQLQIEHNASVGAALDSYMQRAFFGEVEGYFELQAFLTMRVLAASQLENAVSGGVAEIGVHHGLLFTALCLLNSDAGSGQGVALAIDVFEDQHLNLDGSGRGNRHVFENTVDTFCTPHSFFQHSVRVLSADSSTLTADEILHETVERVRFFSIDGSHLAEATYKDMLLAHASLAEGGIVVVDDYFSEGFPGVSEGVQRFFREQDQRCSNAEALRPFLVGFNKVFFTQEAFVGAYQEAVYSHLASIGDSRMHVATKWMLGCPVLFLSELVLVYRPHRDPI